MVAKFYSKTHILTCSVRILPAKFRKKVLKCTNKQTIDEYSLFNMGAKNEEFHAVFESIEKL
jgi:hypothetical protein